jgi:UDP-N-acetylmuramate--alanine ligase
MTTATTTAAIPKRVHLIGVGGAHMSAIAQILHAWGHTITGSDQKASAMTEKLAGLGIAVTIGHAAENVGEVDLVVMTSAAHGDNPEIVEAQRRGIAVIKRAEMVARLMQGRYSIAVAGTHGKTTTSGLIAHMLVEAKLSPTYLIGGEVRSLGTNAAPGTGKYIVVEADEYDRAFLSYTPDVAVVTNIEPDHLDIYGTVEELQSAFGQFMAAVPADGHVIASADSPRVTATLEATKIVARDISTYALEQAATWKATGIVPRHGGSSTAESGQTFSVSHMGNDLGIFTISLAGKHNVSNALAGIAAGATIGIEPEVMRAALATYRGARRRFEYVGEERGITVMDDYAHHPTEVREGTIAAAKQRFPGRRLVLLFQPHTFTRTAYLLEEWTRCFAGADVLYITHTYAAREEAAEGLSGRDLAAAVAETTSEPAGDLTPRPPLHCVERGSLKSVAYVDSFEEAADRIAGDLREGDVFFTVGAGDVDSVGPMVLERLGRG